MSMMRLLSAGKSLVDPKTLTPTYRMRSKFHLPQFGPRKNPFAETATIKPERAEAGQAKSAVIKAEVRAVSTAAEGAGDLKSAEVFPAARVAESNRAECAEGISADVLSAARAETKLSETDLSLRSEETRRSAGTAEPVAAIERVSADKMSAAPLRFKNTQPLPALPESMKKTKKLPLVPAEKSAAKTAKIKAMSGILRNVWRFVSAGFKKLNAFAWAMDHQPKRKSAIPRFDKPAQGELSLDNIRVVRNDLSDSDLELAPAKKYAGQAGFKPAQVSEKPAAESGKAETQPLFSHTCST